MSIKRTHHTHANTSLTGHGGLLAQGVGVGGGVTQEMLYLLSDYATHRAEPIWSTVLIPK